MERYGFEYEPFEDFYGYSVLLAACEDDGGDVIFNDGIRRRLQ